MQTSLVCFLEEVVLTPLPLKRDHLAVIRCFLMASFVKTKKQLFFYFYTICGMSGDKFCLYAVTDAEYNILSPGPLGCVEGGRPKLSRTGHT